MIYVIFWLLPVLGRDFRNYCRDLYVYIEEAD